MIAAISPADINFDESLSTLRYESLLNVYLVKSDEIALIFLYKHTMASPCNFYLHCHISRRLYGSHAGE